MLHKWQPSGAVVNPEAVEVSGVFVEAEVVAVEVVVEEDMRVDEEVGDLMMTGDLLGEMTEEEGVTGEETEVGSKTKK